ncbi:hypothetical protein LWP59_23440 [Amycolatopsis acidiphila]|uniref:Uncharacterized protein n=1 Tax=Amycolatopsis acidiphila TaxID=715473 RepID=A0A558AFB7_9PSEU|nr:hypothetical protein [Amycolatopsis acidiphila]TVT22949.1 hypothetical protein FNH06_11420 [Amycolatopsis acidiphila]UIJ57110.1 hypothetical protein LWP59_23440 [Amycolatopsis acidiphila]GHG53308.1 hypothetical protein GCM10017788_01940 [Amycolatopsis acidiphila]
MDLGSIFAGMSNAGPLDGLSDAWHWAMAPGFDFAAALSEDREHAFQCYALDSYDEELAVAIMSFARAHAGELIAPPERPLVLVEGFGHEPYRFDVFVAVGPTVHKYHAKENPEAHQRTRAVFPAFRCEFAGDENQEETEYRYSRAAGVPVTRLNREPWPYAKMRYRAPTGRVEPERGFVTVPTLVQQVRDLEGGAPERFVEFENYRHEIRRAQWDEAWLIGGEGEDSQRFDAEELLEYLKAFLYGPNLDAGTSEFDK